MTEWMCVCGRNKRPSEEECYVCAERRELLDRLAELDGEQE